jgi:hypothetical protein
MDWILTRETVIVLAVLGAVPSIAASMLQTRGSISVLRARQLNLTGYALMAVSMALFIVAGFRAQ